MKGKTCLITGANSGIGFSTGLALAAKNVTIILHARNPEKANHAKQELLKIHPDANVDTAVADLASFAQIREMAGQIKDKYPVLDVLVNNAGLMTKDYIETENGFETQLAVNHLAPFLLTNLLLPNLKAAPAARVVNVSSDAHYRCKNIDFDNVGMKNGYKGFDVYCQSKLLNVLFTKELARRNAGENITTNALHPGVVNTGIGQKNTGMLGWVWRIMRPFMVSPAKGAETSIFLASSDEVADVTGAYFEKSKAKKPSRLAREQDVAELLWLKSEEWVEL